MGNSSRSSMSGLRAGVVWAAGIGLMCSLAGAAAPPPEADGPPASKADDCSEVVGAVEAMPAPNIEVTPDAQPATKSGQSQGLKKAKTKPASSQRLQGKRKPLRRFEMNPDAKWACDEMTVTLPPVWRGKGTLTFPFEIRNEGKAYLQIRAIGG